MGPWARPAFLSEKHMVKSDPPEQQDFPGGPDGKTLPTMWEIWVQFQGREDPLEKEMGNPLQYCCLENPTDRGAW